LTHVYLFSPIPYSFLHQRPQKLADQFVQRGIPVTFIEPCGLTEYLQRRKKGLVRLVLYSIVYQAIGFLSFVIPGSGSTPRRRRAGSHAEPALSIVPMPMVYPSNRVDSALLEKVNAAIFRQALKRQVLRSIGEDEESIAIVQNPFWGLVLQRGDFTRIAYDCLDEITLFSGRASAERFGRYERHLMDVASMTFVTAEKLEERLRTIAPGQPVVRVPNGVDFEWFQECATGRGFPPDIQEARHPIAGYVGVLRDWFDFDLVGHLALTMPDVSFIMVGPLDFDFRNAHLRTMPNLRWIGRRDYGEMPRYINAFDVCLIPFLAGKVSQTTNPVKVFEYFALGKPVVSTPMHELLPFRNNGLLRLAGGREEFATALRDSLAEPTGEKQELRRDVARRHSWRALTELMLSSLNVGRRP
jgi:glycosyltransferase involved in cell wall biosynthesis